MLKTLKATEADYEEGKMMKIKFIRLWHGQNNYYRPLNLVSYILKFVLRLF